MITRNPAQNSGIYETSDTPLATWLYINGIRLISVKPGTDAILRFDSSSHVKLNDLIFQWDSGNAIGNCTVYQKSYRMLIHRIKGA